MILDIAGLDKSKILARLYNASKPLGLGNLHYDPKPMTSDEAIILLFDYEFRFDYLNGRVMKIDLSGDSLDTAGYDRDNGQGAAFKAIKDIMTVNAIAKAE